MSTDTQPTRNRIEATLAAFGRFRLVRCEIDVEADSALISVEIPSGDLFAFYWTGLSHETIASEVSAWLRRAVIHRKPQEARRA